MSLRKRAAGKEKRRGTDIGLEEIAQFVKMISMCTGALFIVSMTAYLLSGRSDKTDVLYAMIIGFNGIAFFGGTAFVKWVRHLERREEKARKEDVLNGNKGT